MVSVRGRNVCEEKENSFFVLRRREYKCSELTQFDHSIVKL